MARRADQPEADQPEAEPVPTKTISLLVDHVFLPRDPEEADWQASVDTVRAPGKVDGKREKYRVHAELADLLIEQDRAVEVPEG